MNKRDAVLLGLPLMLVLFLTLSSVYVAFSSIDVSEGDHPSVGYLGIAIDSNDDLHVVWADGRDEELFSLDGTFLRTRVYYSKFNSGGKELVQDRPISSGGGRTPYIETDSSDNVWVAYVMNGTYVVKLNADGEKILEKKVLPQMPLTMSLAVGTDDNIYLSWLECSQGQCFQYYVVFDDSAESVLGRTNVSQTSSIPGFPVVLDQNSQYVYLGEDGGVDSNGNIHMIKHHDDYLHFTRIDHNGVVTINNTQIPNTAEWSGPLALRLDSDDYVHITGITSSGIGYMKLNNTGNVITSASGIGVGGSRETQLNPSIDVDSSSSAYVVWHVAEMISDDSHSGSEDYAYASYCAKIDATGSIQDKWNIAKSKTLQAGLPGLLISLVLLSLVSIVIFVFAFLHLAKRRNREEE